MVQTQIIPSAQTSSVQAVETTAAVTTTKTAEVTESVWQSATGGKYHKIPNCGNMNPDKATQLLVKDAISRGLGACSKCY